MCAGSLPGPDPAVVVILVAAAFVCAGTALSIPVNLSAIFRGGRMSPLRQIQVAAAVAATIGLMSAGVGWLLQDMSLYWTVRRYRLFWLSLPFIAAFLAAWRFGRQPAWLAAIFAPAAGAGGWLGLALAVDWARVVTL